MKNNTAFNSLSMQCNSPINSPQKINGEFRTKLSLKVVQKTHYVRSDGSCALYIQIFLKGRKKMIPLNISVAPSYFDKKKQRIRSRHKFSSDYNLLIEKKLSEINQIELNYRLSDTLFSLDVLIENLQNPSANADFIKFWQEELEKQKNFLKKGTFRQQKSSLKKLKCFMPVILFSELTENLINDYIAYCKNLGNGKSTINTALKNLKKYVHLANKQGISTPISYDYIKPKTFKGNRTFLTSEEIQKIYKYYNDTFCNSHRAIIAKFLFSCFSGLRFSDVFSISPENIVEDNLVFTAEKTGKFQRFKMNKTCISLLTEDFFTEKFTNEYVNRELKIISKICGISKKLTFHVSRHTFATQFLMRGGRVEHLQKILGHSKIEETMIYVHLVESYTNNQIMNLDAILS